MTEYEAGLPVRVAFPPLVIDSLAAHLLRLGWRQFHVAETEKYAHVTYFFNGGVEEPMAGRGAHPRPESNRKVATYDLAARDERRTVTDALVAAIDEGRYDFIVANYANPDMVGHTGVWDATVQALTAHSLNPVPLLAWTCRRRARAGGRRPRRRGAHDPRAGRPPALGEHDREIAPGAGVTATAGRNAPGLLPSRSVTQRRFKSPVNPILAIGQILLSIGLIAAILLQARGTGLSGTFGGDSAVYRSRRGVERSLWQFTIVLLALFVLFALAAFIFA
jgi:protein translocase SecG subunit